VANPRKRQNHEALKQIPFNGKKLKPAKLRKDYWRPMAMIQFGEGSGDVGRSVYQKLREFRKRHELEWGERATELYALNKRARGEALNDQKGTAVADISAVLAGAGKGNKVWHSVATEDGKTEEQLTPATIFWANEMDRSFARDWSENVTHILGLPTLAAEEAVLEKEADGSALEGTPSAVAPTPSI
jgi:hypothetical protein